LRVLGVGLVRKSISGSELTSARMISSTVLNSETHPVNDHTLIVMQWGQFIAHDLVQTEKRFSGSKNIYVYIVTIIYKS